MSAAASKRPSTRFPPKKHLPLVSRQESACRWFPAKKAPTARFLTNTLSNQRVASASHSKFAADHKIMSAFLEFQSKSGTYFLCIFTVKSNKHFYCCRINITRKKLTTSFSFWCCFIGVGAVIKFGGVQTVFPW